MSLTTLSHPALPQKPQLLSVIMAGQLADPFTRPSPTAVFIQQPSLLLRCSSGCREDEDIP